MSLVEKVRTLAERIIKFGIVGASGVLVNLGLYALLTRAAGLGETLLGKNVSYAASVELSILSNFLLNDLWTFADRRGHSGFFTRLGRFHVVSLIGFGVNFGVFAGINLWLSATDSTIVGVLKLGPFDFGNVDDFIAAALGIGLAMTWNFLGNLLWTWKAGGPK
jgi:dolichol-phosphate mannosyltransferase